MRFYAALLLLLLSGCGQAPSYVKPEPEEITAIVAGVMAFYESKGTANPDQPDRPRTCDECEGDGLVPSGDRLSEVTCRCGTRCACEPLQGKPAAAKPPGQRMLLFSASWCGPCVRWKQNVAPAMRESHWLIDADPGSHIQLIDYDANPGLVQKYSVGPVPTFIVVDSAGRELRRHVGELSADQVVNLYHGRPAVQASQPAQEVQQAAPVQYYYQSDRRGRRARRLFRGCSSGSCY